MKRQRASTCLQLTLFILAAIVLASSQGCGSFPPHFDRSTAASLRTALGRLESNNQSAARALSDQGALVAELADAMMQIEHDRTQASLLRDLDEWLTADGQGAASIAVLKAAIADSENHNALIEEVRLGRLSIEGAMQIVSDFAASRKLSSARRMAVEGDLVGRFQAMRDIEARQSAIRRGVQQMTASEALVIRDTDQWISVLEKMAGASSAGADAGGSSNRDLLADVLMQTAQATIHDDALRQSVMGLIRGLADASPPGADVKQSD